MKNDCSLNHGRFIIYRSPLLADGSGTLSETSRKTSKIPELCQLIVDAQKNSSEVILTLYMRMYLVYCEE